jgi:uncharacterized protein (TIGR02145 family)
MKNYFYKLIAVALLLAAVSCKKEVSVTGVNLEPASLTLAIDHNATLTASVQPTDATNKEVTWTSSNNEVVTVSNGTVTAKALGVATIIVTTQEGGFTAKCVIVVTSGGAEEIGIVINGIKWATRNLAFKGKFVENPEDYGALFQWGRVGDGHEFRTSKNYPTHNDSINGVVSSDRLNVSGQIVSTDSAFSKFVKQSGYPYDWRDPQNGYLWNRLTEATPQKTENDPCPNGWRVPTGKEMQSLINAGSEWAELNGVNGRYFGKSIFLPAAGYRAPEDGNVNYTETGGLYWSSAVNGINAQSIYFNSGNVEEGGNLRASGFSVRCVADR